MLRIYIPTYRRTDAQHTLTALPPEWQRRATLVVDAADAGKIDFLRKVGREPLRRASYLVVPETIQTIAKKRAWILRSAANHGEERIVMFDDDLRFASRRYEGEEFKLRPSSEEDIDLALRELEARLGDLAHAGFSARQGNNRLDSGWLRTRRMMYALGYRPQVVVENCELGRIETREDFDYTLQLFRKGYDNEVLSEICVDQTYNAKGGCSEQRTVEASNADAEKLAELHPGLVKVVEKDYKASLPRKEVVVQWKQALEQGKQA